MPSIRFLALLGLLNFAAGLCAAPANPPGLDLVREARRVLFLGDSITFQGDYVVDTETWLLRHAPAAGRVCLNLGLASETVSGLSEPGHAGGKFPRPDLHERLDRVLAAVRPDLVFACYGMNDGAFLPFAPERLAAYRAGLQKLHTRATAAGARIVFLTSPVYDEKRGRMPAYADVLARQAEWLLAQRAAGWTVIDLHGPMRAELDRRRAADPAFFFAKDAVHPDAAGHRFLARTLLAGLGAADLPPPLEPGAPDPDAALRQVVRQRHDLLRDAWLTATRHLRPGVPPGLPLPEAERRSAELTATIRAQLAETDPLAKLRPGHPRLLVSAADWPRLRALAASDANYRAITDAALAEARRRLAAPLPVRQLEGKRLLWVSRRVLADAIFFGAAHHLDGDPAFLAAAERNLLAAAAFPDWNPAHFLDVAEMTAALALGYDWLHAELAPATRATLRAAILEKGLRPGLDPASSFNWWHTRANNWNQVCLGGLTLGALAIAEDEPAAARATLALLASSHPRGLKPYEPDGIYPEGPGYWRFGGGYTALTLAALRTALGDEDLMPGTAAFYAGARVQTLLTAPSGQPFTFADCGVSAVPDPLLFWFAQRLGDPSLLTGQHRHFTPYVRPAKPPREDAELLFPLLYWQTPPPATDSPWEAWCGAGPVPVAVFRGPGDATRRFYLAVKGGSPSDSHGHMDGGSFALETDGVRWADDLGMQAYHQLENAGLKIFDAKQEGDRWRVFRYTNPAHNTLTIDQAPHRVDGRVLLTDFSAPPAPGVSADLVPVLGTDTVSRAVRRFTPHPDARGLTVTDDLAGLRPGARVTWTLVTPADADIQGAVARLSRQGRRLDLRVAAPAEVAWEIAPASGPAPHDARSPGHRLFRFTATAPASGELKLEVVFAPPPLENAK
jgi:lysophospholipase L1-like esterase